MTSLVLGAAKKASPRPDSANTGTVSHISLSFAMIPAMDAPSKRAAIHRAIPADDRILGGYLSESFPITGERTDIIPGDTTSKRPACCGSMPITPCI